MMKFCMKFLFFISIDLTRFSFVFVLVRSSCPEVFCKKGALRDFAKFTGKHLCQSLFFNKFLKKRLWHMFFHVNFVKFLRTPFLTEHLRWLLLFGAFTLFLLNLFSWVTEIYIWKFSNLNFFQVGWKQWTGLRGTDILWASPEILWC